MFNVECLMFKEIKVMKTLRYLLIAFAAMMVLSVSAQSMAQEPQVGFQSTSSMVGSGSTLPQAAQSGAYTTYDMDQEIARGKGVIRTWADDEDPDAPAEPNPIGDGLWALIALAVGYAVFRIRRKCVKALNS